MGLGAIKHNLELPKIMLPEKSAGAPPAGARPARAAAGARPAGAGAPPTGRRPNFFFFFLSFSWRLLILIQTNKSLGCLPRSACLTSVSLT